MNFTFSFIKIRQWIGVVLLIFSVLFFVRYAFMYLDEVPGYNWGGEEWSVIFISILFYTSSIGVLGMIWQLLLWDHGLKPKWFRLQIIFSIAQFAKYLPGNVAHHVGRVYMAKEIGVPISVTVHIMLVEALFGVGIGSALALLSLLFMADVNVVSGPVSIEPSMLSLIMLITLSLPWLVVRFLNKYLPHIAKKISGGERIAEPRFRTAFAVAGLFLICFLIIGIVLKFHANWLFNTDELSVLQFTAIFAVAWVAGYIVPGAPAGLGVREALMILLFSPLLGPAVAVGLSISLRIATTMGDGLAFLIGLLARKVMSKNRGRTTF